MKRIPADGMISKASMKADPTIPKMSLTPLASSVSTKASLAYIGCLVPNPAEEILKRE